MKVTIDARKLEDVDVSFVSLVKRGANMIPFRIIKQEKEQGMNLDLGSMFTTKKAQAPKVAAYVVDNTKVSDALIEKMEAEGFVKQESESEITTIFKAVDYSEDSSIVKMDKDCAVVLDDVKKSFYSYPEGNDFNDNLAKNTFFPSVDMAQEVLEETIANIMYDESVAVRDKAPALELAIESFKQYVSALVTKLPTSAFEMATYLRIEPAVEAEVNVEVSVGKEESETQPISEVAKEETPVEVEEVSITKESEGEPVDISLEKHQGVVEGLDTIDKDTAGKGSELVVKTEEVVAAEDKGLEAILKSLKTVSDKIDSIEKSNAALASRIGESEKATALIAKSVEETVMVGSDVEEQPAQVVKKEEASDLYSGTALDMLEL